MKSTILLCFTLLVATIAFSQKKTFVRVFDEKGKKIQKGFLVATTDSSLTLQLGEKFSEIPINRVSVLKLTRSIGNKILLSSLILGASFAILGAATANPDAWIFAYSTGEGAASGLLLGGGLGVLTGAFLHAVQKKPVFQVNRQVEQWLKVKEQLQEYLPNPESK